MDWPPWRSHAPPAPARRHDVPAQRERRRRGAVPRAVIVGPPAHTRKAMLAIKRLCSDVVLRDFEEQVAGAARAYVVDHLADQPGRDPLAAESLDHADRKEFRF